MNLFSMENRVNDRVISANGVSLENVDYSQAVQVLRECGNSVNLLIKRRTILPNSDLMKVTLTKTNKKDGLTYFTSNCFMIYCYLT